MLVYPSGNSQTKLSTYLFSSFIYIVSQPLTIIPPKIQIMSNPAVFEDMLQKIVGKNAADNVIESIRMEFKYIASYRSSYSSS
jgi:hypothetical protein